MTKSEKRRKAATELVWPDTLNHVHQMDCIEGMRAMPDASVDCAWADPPFNIARSYKDYDDDLDPLVYLQWTADWIDECVRILKPTGSLWICASEEFVSEIKIVAEGRYALVAGDDGVIIRAGKPLKPRHHVIWTFTFGIASPKKLGRSHTHILHFVKSAKKHQWFPEEVRVPSAREMLYNDKRASPNGKLPDDTWILRPQDPGAGFGPGEDVMHVPRVCGTYKEKQPVDNQMPEQLLARIFRLCTEEGDIICDPFGGSCTGAAVAKKLGRQFITFEISPAYALQGDFRVGAAEFGAMLDRSEAQPALKRRKLRRDA